MEANAPAAASDLKEADVAATVSSGSARRVRRVAFEQRLALIIYWSSLVVAALWALLAPEPQHYSMRVLVRLLIVSLVALGGLGWALETRRLDSAMQRVRAELLEELVLSDDLTGLANRRAFFSRLQQEWQRYQRYRRPFSVVILDLDRFKAINDRYGHHTGDLALQWLADHFARCLRSGDLAARLGGDEFALLLPETPAPAAIAVLERLQHEIEADTSLVDEEYGESVKLRISAGVSAPDEQSMSAEQILRAADAHLYSQKTVRASGDDGRLNP